MTKGVKQFIWHTYLREQLTLLWRLPPEWLMLSSPADMEKKEFSLLLADPVLAAVNPPPPTVRPFVVRLMCSTTKTPVCVCVWAEEAESGMNWKLTIGSSCFPSHSPLSSSTSLCRDFHSAPPPLIKMQTHASHPCWGRLLVLHAPQA